MDNNQTTIFKGELMEELVRNYFLNLGFYVARGVKLRYENNDITDIDLFLYDRSSSLTRQRINVDIKNKKSPQAFERIVWANGIMKILNFDACIVATTDVKPAVHHFAQSHKTTILDGVLLQKLKTSTNTLNRFSEEELLSQMASFTSYKTFGNKNWRHIYEQLKSKLLTELDYSGFNGSSESLKYFIEKSIIDEQKKDCALRLTYIIVSQLLIIMDFILKDIAFLEQKDREKKLSDGLKFGNLGKDGVDKIISMAVQISGSNSSQAIMKSLENVPVDILRDFFARLENGKNLFTWAKEFEGLGFNKELVTPNTLDTPLKGVLSVLLDFMKIERKKYFECFKKNSNEMP